MDMNITTTIFEELNSTTTTALEWSLDMNNSNSDYNDIVMSLVTPLALASKHSKHHIINHENVSPVTLSSEWPRLSRLIFLTILSVIGSIGNIFMISSVMVEDHLKKAGKVIANF